MLVEWPPFGALSLAPRGALEAELDRISVQAEMGMQEGREKRTRDIAAKQSAEQHAEFQKRMASTNPWRTLSERIPVQN